MLVWAKVLHMARVTLLCVGSLKFPWAREACEQYLLRMGPRVTVQELAASKHRDPKKQMEEESGKLIDALAGIDGDVWVLDERGKSFTSADFAQKLVTPAADRGDTLVFVLGGAYGLTDEVRTGRKLLRLSDMVLPHELARVVFLEQLYRAREIEKGTGYHH